MKTIRIAAAIALAFSLNVQAAESVPQERPIGHAERVFAFHDAMPTGVSVSETGRIFVNFPQWGDDVKFSVGELRDGRVVAYPSQAANADFSSVQSVVADGRGKLWVLDTSAPGFAAPKAPKLVAVDLATDQVSISIAFPSSVILPTTYVNDVRFDFRVGAQGVAYVTDSSLSGPGAIIVLDLASGKAQRRLSGHASTSPDPDFIPTVEGESMKVRTGDGSTQKFTVASDGIALSADGQTLYYSPLSSRHLYSVPAALLRDPKVSEAQLAAAVKDLGEKGASDGLEADANGALYATDYEHNSIRKRAPDGSWTTIASDGRLLWPDTMSIGPDGYLYFTANQLHRQAIFHGGHDQREKSYGLFRVKIDARPAPTK
ncbi:L-dopachrome tautomerase-related protein [Duganella callida]|uniref:Gluconolaconase n=1 Tax=Duganella callida TaxID=2561932 RepID=A0A4Y9RXM5_9BURK|nr:L-dopachrome tautomerase-related protein [Duganella callida]TFW13804.1 gluconolaconase [Duganella callida]